MTREEAKRVLNQQTYPLIDLERVHRCSGCDRTDKPLDHSHIISQDRLINGLNQPELIAEPELITFHCRDCHRKHENGDTSLMDFRETMKVIKKYDSATYRKMVSKTGIEV